MEKFSESSGLGISLEASSGHHYIRSVLPEGPVGRCGKLFSGDELLEVSRRTPARSQSSSCSSRRLANGPRRESQRISASCHRSTASL